MEKGPNPSKVWKDIKKNKAESAETQREERLHAEFYKKGLRPDPEFWSVYDSTHYGFESTFSGVLPEKYTSTPLGQRLRAYIIDALNEGTRSRENQGWVAVEFGGTGRNFFRAFPKGFFNKTAAVCLFDPNREQQIENDREDGHWVLEGDFTDPKNLKIYNYLANIFGPQKVGLIISRMQGGLDRLIKNPDVMDIIARRWYQMLDENGIILVQFENADTENDPETYENLVTKRVENWVKAMKKKFRNKIELQIDSENNALRLQKKPGAPEELPAWTELFK